MPAGSEPAVVSLRLDFLLDGLKPTIEYLVSPAIKQKRLGLSHGTDLALSVNAADSHGVQPSFAQLPRANP
jgi:hypothetical protein